MRSLVDLAGITDGAPRFTRYTGSTGQITRTTSGSVANHHPPAKQPDAAEEQSSRKPEQNPQLRLATGVRQRRIRLRLRQAGPVRHRPVRTGNDGGPVDLAQRSRQLVVGFHTADPGDRVTVDPAVCGGSVGVSTGVTGPPTIGGTLAGGGVVSATRRADVASRIIASTGGSGVATTRSTVTGITRAIALVPVI